MTNRTVVMRGFEQAFVSWGFSIAISALKSVLTHREWMLLAYISRHGTVTLSNIDIPRKAWGETLSEAQADREVMKARNALKAMNLIIVRRIYTDTDLPQQKAMETTPEMQAQACRYLYEHNAEYAAMFDEEHALALTGSTIKNDGSTIRNDGSTIKNDGGVVKNTVVTSPSLHEEDITTLGTLFDVTELTEQPPFATLRDAPAKPSRSRVKKTRQDDHVRKERDTTLFDFAVKLAREFGHDALLDKGRWLATAKRCIAAGYTLVDLDYIRQAWNEPKYDWFRDKGIPDPPESKLNELLVAARELRKLYYPD